MYLERKQDLSLYHYVKELFTDIETISVVDGFPEIGLTIPCIAVDIDEITTEKVELGNQDRMEYRTWFIDVFAITKTQRNEFGYRLINSLEECIPVYDYDEGFPPEYEPTKLGCLLPDEVSLRIIPVFPELVEKMYYRAKIRFTARYDKF